MIIYSTDSRGAVVFNDAGTVRHYVHRDRVLALLKQIQRPTAATTIQVTTGITADESELLDLWQRVSGVAS